MNNEPVALTQGDILGILQDAHSVSLCQPIWNSTEEYNKLKAIIESAIRYTHPVKELSRMDIYELAIESGFMLSTQYGEAEHKLMPASDGDTLVKLANAILRKAQE